MISLSTVWSLARAEMRTIRRLFRFWLFALVALVLCLFQYGYFWVIHGLFSGISATLGAMSPKFLLSQTALFQTMVLGLAAGSTFLSFRVPVHILPSLALNGGFVSSISDVAPQILAQGAVEIELSDDTTGNVVAADAVRFVHLDNGADADTTGGGGAPGSREPINQAGRVGRRVPQ